MSAGIYVIDPKRLGIAMPATLKDFGAILEKWAGVEGEPNPAFVELARRLEARFPSPEVAGADSVWLSSPVAEAAALTGAIWNLGLPDREMVAAERLIAQAAGALGLIAYDDQVGIGFLPGGAIVPEERRALWEGTLAAIDAGLDIEGETGVKTHVLPALQAILAPLGFKLQPERDGEYFKLVRTLGALRQVVSIRSMRYGRVQLFFAVYHDALTAFWYALAPKAVFEMSAFMLDLEFFHPGPEWIGSWYVSHPHDVRPLVELMQRKVIPLASFCRDLHGLDQLLNDESADAIRTVKGRHISPRRPDGGDGSAGIRDGGRSWGRLFIAHLAGNPRVAEIAAQAAAHAQSADMFREEYVRVVAALPGVAPLAKWRDAAQHRASMRRIPAALLERAPLAKARRLHHYEFSRVLEKAAQADPAAFWSEWSAPGSEARLRELWQARAATLPLEDRLEATGLACGVRAVAGSPGGPVEVLLVEFPPAPNLDETSYLAIARRGELHIVYTFDNEHQLRDRRVVPKFVYTHGPTQTHEFREPRDLGHFLAHIAATFPARAAA
jgi:hypothetical protein